MTDKEIIKAFNKKRNEELLNLIVRPDFSLYKEILQFLAAVSVISLTVYFKSVFSGTQFLLIVLAEVFLFIFSQTKNILLLMIFFYQKFAPAQIRAVCLFTPSCSEYMRLSIIRYGVFKGVRKGYLRLKRCRPPNGGIDEP